MFLVSLFSRFPLWGRKAFIVEYFLLGVYDCLDGPERIVLHEEMFFCACEKFVSVSVKEVIVHPLIINVCNWNHLHTLHYNTSALLR